MVIASPHSLRLAAIVAVLIGGARCGSGMGSRPEVDGAPSGSATLDGGALDVGVGAWTAPTTAPAPVPLDDVTVYAFSQTPDDVGDPQVLALAPDMNMRAWQRFDTYGVMNDYDFRYVADAHAAGVKVFIGGTTATALFPDEFPNAQFPSLSVDDVSTRDANNQPVIHDKILPDLRRGSLANPEYRAYLVRICKMQIDGGVDGLYFDEINQDYEGADFDGNEGFDAYHLADFNAYLLWRFPGADYGAMFGMTSDNLLTAGVPAGDLVNNFNYQKYLAGRGWGSSPFDSRNPLRAIWGQTVGGRPTPGAADFVNSAEPYRYGGAIVSELRDYAQRTYGRAIYLAVNGVYPLVDFQGVGLFAYNNDGDGGAEAPYVPVMAGSTTMAAQLDGTVSLQRPFLNLKTRSEALAPGAPVVLFLDWPNDFISYFFSMPPTQREDYWRIYAAEAYANGLFFAFHLQDTVGDPSATQLGLMPLYQRLAAFYRGHATFYHHVAAATEGVTSQITTSLTTAVMLAVADQKAPRRRLVHMVNHDYHGALVEHDGFTVTVPVPGAPAVTLASPDAADDITLPVTYANGTATVTVPSLIAYDVLTFAY